MASEADSTGGATPEREKAVRAETEVGGVRSSEDSVPDLWFGEPAEERRDATCSAERKHNKGLVTALWAISANNVLALLNPRWRCGLGRSERNSESRMRENRSSGLMRGGKQTVIGPRASQSVASRLLYSNAAKASVKLRPDRGGVR